MDPGRQMGQTEAAAAMLLVNKMFILPCINKCLQTFRSGELSATEGSCIEYCIEKRMHAMKKAGESIQHIEQNQRALGSNF